MGSPGEWAIFTSKPIPGLTSFDPKKEGVTGHPFRPGFHDRTPYLYGLAETSPTPMLGLLPMHSVMQCFGTYSNCYKHQVNIKRSCEKLEDADSKKQRPLDDETPAINAPRMNLAWAIDTMHSKLTPRGKYMPKLRLSETLRPSGLPHLFPHVLIDT